jgi:hypothetical protein
VSTETIPELLDRLERHHTRTDRSSTRREVWACSTCIVAWPCSVARVVAHARSLEAALKVVWDSADIKDIYGTVAAALGEAQ